MNESELAAKIDQDAGEVMATSDGLGASPGPSAGQRLLAEIAGACEYSADEDSGVDALIAYKDALEDRLCSLVDGVLGDSALSDEARALIAACVATADEIDTETLTAPPCTWEEVRAAFPLSLYHDSRVIEGGIV